MHRLAAALVFAVATMPALAQQAYVPIEQRLTAEQLRETGLDRLDSAQLALLNRLLSEDRAEAVQAAAAASVSSTPNRAPKEKPTPIDSRIRGTFRGWDAGTVFELDNGQAWRVSEGSLSTRAVESPGARIEPGFLGAWYLQVEGQPVRAKVRRVR